MGMPSLSELDRSAFSAPLERKKPAVLFFTKASFYPRACSCNLQERQAFPALLVVVGVKFWKQVSVDGFLSDVFFYAKVSKGH